MQSHLDSVVTAELRLKDEKITSWIYVDPTKNPELRKGYSSSDVNRPNQTMLFSGYIQGEANQIKAEGLLALGDDEFPVSLHITVPVACTFIPLFGDNIKLTIERA